VDETKRRTSWPLIDELEIKGDYRGRAVIAKYQDRAFHFFITFGTVGQITEFREL
jgi:hypothetical protein